MSEWGQIDPAEQRLAHEREKEILLGPADARERFLNDPEFHAACVATMRQAGRDGGYLEPETVAKVLMAFDRSGVGRLVKLDERLHR